MGTVIKVIMMRYLWREVKEKFRDDVVVCGSQTFIQVSFPINHLTIFLMVGVGLGEMYRLLESSNCLGPAERDMSYRSLA